MCILYFTEPAQVPPQQRVHHIIHEILNKQKSKSINSARIYYTVADCNVFSMFSAIVLRLKGPPTEWVSAVEEQLLYYLAQDLL